MRLTQEERRARTSDKLISTAIELIARRGLAVVTTKQIADEAGVSWGAAQHLFGNKLGFFKEIGARLLAQMIANVALPAELPTSRTAAIAQFTEIVWRSFCSETYLAWIEFVRGAKSDPPMRAELEKLQDQYIAHLESVWAALLPRAPGQPENFFLMHHIVLTLSGLASRRIFLHDRIAESEHIDLLIRLTSSEVSR